MRISRLVSAIFCLFFLFTVQSAKAQIGFKVSLLSPLSDFGASFKKAPAYELYYASGNRDGLIVGQLGFYYTFLKPRLDTFSSYLIGYPDSGPVIVPGYVTYQKFTMAAFYIDVGARIIRRKKFSLLGSIGLEGGINHLEYTREYETMLSETGANIDRDFVGFRTRLNLDYALSKHVNLYLEFMNHLTTLTDWSAQFPSNNIGFGINYYFKALDSEE